MVFEQSLKYGLPESVASELASFAPDWHQGVCDFPGKNVLIQRAMRFHDFWRRSAMNKRKAYIDAWRTLAETETITGQDGALYFFYSLPDSPKFNPHDDFFGLGITNNVALRMRQKEFVKLHEAAELLHNFIADKKRFGSFIKVSLMTPEACRKASTYEALHHENMQKALPILSDALGAIDIFRCIPAKQPNSPNAPMQNYLRGLAEINLRFKSRCTSAIVMLANINCPDHKITADRLHKTSDRLPNKGTGQTHGKNEGSLSG